MTSFYLTTPIYYVNAKPHLGHAYSTIVADATVRFHRMLGEDAIFLTGTDEHGDKIVQAAEKKNMAPAAFVDEISSGFRKLWPKLACSPEYFERTTSPAHKQAVQAFLQKIYDAGDIYFGEFGGYYCYGCERFYTEKELEGGLCPQHLTKPQFINEKNYFFRMSRYLPWLKELLESQPELVQPERYRREALGMLESGELEDLCISRPKTRLQWGIELPFDPDYVCYVWFDALVAYISGIGWPVKMDNFHKWWPGCHLVAKDILKPHAIFWPCMLKAAGLEMYRQLYVHGYWLSRQTKMSKSLGNVVEPLETAERFGLDAFRYFLLREMRFGHDANFSEEALVARINADLANDLGNLFSRVLSMAAKYCAGTSPAAGPWSLDDHAIAALAGKAMRNFLKFWAEMEFALGLEALWELASGLNKYVDAQAPWVLHKNGNSERLGTVINLLLSGLRKLALFLWPAMPDAASAMLAQLGEEELPRKAANGEAPALLTKEAESFEAFPSGRKLAKSSALFPRIEPTREEKPEKVNNEKGKAENEPASVDIGMFQALDIRAGKILKAAKHPAADKLLMLEIDFGEEKPRQILSGIAGDYAPEELAGRMICAILNLPPRKIRGELSNGMVLTAQDDKGNHLLDPGADTTPGSKIA